MVSTELLFWPENKDISEEKSVVKFTWKPSDSKWKWYSEDKEPSILMSNQIYPSEIHNGHYINGTIGPLCFTSTCLQEIVLCEDIL